MSWVILVDDFPDHPKMLGLSDAAFRAWVSGLCYCSRYLTDGWVAGQVAPRSAATELVKAGLWVVDGSGYQVHDYLDYQQSRAQVQQRHQQRSDAGRLGAQKRWGLDT